MLTQEIEKFIKVDHDNSWRSVFTTAKNILDQNNIKLKSHYNNSLCALLEELPEDYFWDQESTTIYKKE